MKAEQLKKLLFALSRASLRETMNVAVAFARQLFGDCQGVSV